MVGRSLCITSHDNRWYTQSVRNDPLRPTFRIEDHKRRICDEMEVIRFGMESHGVPQEPV
jgi:hypothetical protein